MSYCAIITFKFGRPDQQIKYGNAWGGAAYVWTALYDKYLKDPAIAYDSWLTDFRENQGKRLWGLAYRTDLPAYERAVNFSTFDYAIVRREHFERFCADLREFVTMNPPPRE